LKNIILVEKIYEGSVMSSSWHDNSFKLLTGAGMGRVRTFNLKSIHSLDIINPKKALKIDVVSKFHVQSSSSKTKQYIVEVVGDVIRCSCPGWIHYRKCKHLDAMKEMLK